MVFPDSVWGLVVTGALVSTAFVIAGGAALFLGLLLIRFQTLIQILMKPRDDLRAVQAMHVGQPMRLGGLAVTLATMVGALVLSSQSDGHFTQLILLSALPVFLAGFSEDLGHLVSPRGRFAAALVSAAVAVAVIGVWVPRGDLPGLNAIMAFAPSGIVITVLVAALFCHAVNLVDGLNGLAGTTVVISALGLAIVAGQAGLGQISVLSALIAAAMLGFLPLNWPVARLFLGDGGAYGLGHILVWLAISTIAFSAEVAVPAMILVLFWPFADTVHSMLRRLFEAKSVTAPDRMHLHQKMMRAAEIVWLGRGRRHLANPVATLMLAPFIAAPVLAGVVLWRDPVLAWIALAGFGTAFSGLHVVITSNAVRFRRRDVSGQDVSG